MSTNSNIEWTEKTWNPLAGCTRVSAGCDNCYAVGMALRLEAMALAKQAKGLPLGLGGLRKYIGVATRTPSGTAAFNGKINLDEWAINSPLGWNKSSLIFVNSMSDLFHKDVPETFLDRVFLVMKEASWHTFQVLTKRPERMKEYVNRRWTELGLAYAPNIWLGTSVEDQASANERLPHLVNTRAHVRFVSCEPLLGAVDATHWLSEIHWAIVGGESGKVARPMHPGWARSLRDQCQGEGVSFFFKQWGEYASVSEVAGKGEHYHFEDGATVRRVGKHAAGRLLDGREWSEMPEVRHV